MPPLHVPAVANKAGIFKMPIATIGRINISNLTSSANWIMLDIMKFDIHVHTTLSPCSHLTIDDILSRAKDKGLDGVCITDHDTMAIRHHISEGIQDNGLCLIFGMEYSSPDGDFLLFGPYEELRTGIPAPLLLRHVEQSGGIAIAAHPFRHQRSTSEHLVRDKLCRIVEGINGRNSSTENIQVQQWKDRYEINQIGGSDAHSPDELGLVATTFHARIANRAEFIQALKHNCYDQVAPEPLSPQAYG